jgi:hypothetical protein
MSAHELSMMLPTPEPPASGPAKLQWLRIKLGHTYAAMTLVQSQQKALRALPNPSAAQREVMDSLPKHLQELEQQAKEQEDEIEGFDVDAPPQVVDPYPRIGPPTKVSTALSLTHEQWNKLFSLHLGPSVTLSDTAYEALDRYLKDMRGTLAALHIPGGLAARAQELFLPVVDALVQRETTRDRVEAEKVLAARWDEFILQVRALGT